MGPFLPNCIFEGFFSLVHASLKIHLFYKALYGYYIWPTLKKILIGFVRIVSLGQNPLGVRRQWLFSFSTGYVINFKLEILCTGLMQ